MRVSAKADYAVRAAIELATAPEDQPVKGDAIAVAQEIPLRFLENILTEMRQQGAGAQPAWRRRRLLARAHT